MQIKPNWDTENRRFWYRNDGPEGSRDFVLVHAEQGRREAAFDHAKVAALLSEELDEPVDAQKLPLESLAFCERPDGLDLVGPQGAWRLDLDTYTLTRLDQKADEGLPFDREVRPSRRTGPETWIHFENRLAETILLYWSNTEGKRQAYGRLEPGAKRRQHTFAGHIWLATREDGEILAVFEAADHAARAVVDGREPQARRRVRERNTRTGNMAEYVASPDETWRAFVRDHNLWLRETATGRERPLSLEGNANDSYHRDVQRSRLVGMAYDRPDFPASLPEVYWSPDSRYLVALRTRAVTPRTVYMVEAAPEEQLQPKLHSYPYLKPGDDIPVGTPHLFDVERGCEIPLDQTRFAHPWSIGDIQWQPDSSTFTFLYNQRGHQVMRVLAVDVPRGTLRAVVDESCETFFCYSSKLYSEILHESREMIWMSERDGWNHLYLIDTTQGTVKHQITRGPWVVRKVERVDREKRQLFFQAGGMVPGEDPYYLHTCRVDFDGSNLLRLTEGDGHHSVQWSPDRRYLIDTWSRVDLPPIHDLRRADDGSRVCRLEAADAGEVLERWGAFPEPFVAKGRDGKTDIYGMIHRPRDLDTGKRYPIVESIYAGPHSAHVPKAFRASYGQRRMVDLGFVVVQIDGMGTSHRSKAFHDVCWRNLVDAGLPDRVRWIQAAAQAYPYLDLSRVGIFGGSAGGQNALGALLTQGDFYRVAVADCGCHDNRMDKIWWNEQWMGWPVGPHYAAQSNVTLAPRLQGKLLLIVGELDRNVDPASTMQVVDALVRADRDFDMLVVPGAGHGAAGTPYGRRRQQAFFVEHLLKEEPE
jgi:dipeptidyl aminopeptidase/acylaminoacyl peptidase